MATHSIDISILLKSGIKEALIMKLDYEVIKHLISYTMDNFKASNLPQLVITLISLELRGKVGSIYLAAHHLATPLQLKNLSKQNIKELVEDHLFHQDHAITIKNLKNILIMQQQEKLFLKTDGIKGEFFVDPYEKEDKDEQNYF